MSEDLPIEVTCRVIGVSVPGFNMWRRRKPSGRSVRHTMIADVIRDVHDESRTPTAPAVCMPITRPVKARRMEVPRRAGQGHGGTGNYREPVPQFSAGHATAPLTLASMIRSQSKPASRSTSSVC
jgi:hypothetical protein